MHVHFLLGSTGAKRPIKIKDQGINICKDYNAKRKQALKIALKHIRNWRLFVSPRHCLYLEWVWHTLES